MDFISEDIQQYAALHSSKEPELLARLNRETHLKVLYPRMLSGHLQGRILSMLTKLIHPKKILEVGTYTGYSALCMAEGLQEGGKLITIDKNAELETIAKRYFREAGVASQIDLRIGDAQEIIPALSETFDLAFIDADKQNYLLYYQLILPKLSPGGIILADNVLWSGKVLRPAENDKETAGLQKFNEYLTTDTRVEQILLPIRDGISVIRKL